MSAINAKLDSFAKNLEKISKLERLSGPGANCFEAISGIYRSLQRVYEHEKKLAQTIADNQQDKEMETEVTCKKSGQPRMNARRTVGLSIDYWRNEHLLNTPSQQAPPASTEDQPMPDATPEQGSTPSPSTGQDEGPYTLHIDIQPCPATLYPPLRTSSNWVSDAVVKPSLNVSGNSQDKQHLFDIDWQDIPELTLTNPELPLPQARFIAIVDPPITLPLNVAAQVLASVGTDVDLAQDQIQQTTFEELSLPEHPGLMNRNR